MTKIKGEIKYKEHIGGGALDRVAEIEFDLGDGFWLNLWAGMAMQGFIAAGLTSNSEDVALYAVQRAFNLLEEKKRREDECHSQKK